MKLFSCQIRNKYVEVTTETRERELIDVNLKLDFAKIRNCDSLCLTVFREEKRYKVSTNNSFEWHWPFCNT